MGKSAPQHLVLGDGILRAMALNILTLTDVFTSLDLFCQAKGTCFWTPWRFMVVLLPISAHTLWYIEDLSRGSALRNRKDNWIGCRSLLPCRRLVTCLYRPSPRQCRSFPFLVSHCPSAWFERCYKQHDIGPSCTRQQRTFYNINSHYSPFAYTLVLM